MKCQAKRVSGFTLIELLVVVGIIVLLIAILLPALGIAKQQTRKVETNALLVGLSANIEQYYSIFAAYPGPVPTSQIIASSNKVSGAQNLLIGLTYPMTTPAASSPSVTISGTTVSVNPTTATGPVDLSTTPNRTYPPFYSPAAKEISTGTSSTAWPAAGVTGAITAENSFGFPVITDRYPDALPVLYYRRNVGKDALLTSATSTGEAYSIVDNEEYTMSTALRSSSGITYKQTNGVFTHAEFNAMVMAPGGNSARGGYLLLSAGQDRTYGKLNGKTDDIYVVGGN